MAVREFLEEARADAAFDHRFYKQHLYFFELTLPASVRPAEALTSTNGGFLYPLIHAPQTYDFDLPLITSESAGGDGGLVVEENGAVGFPIVLTGTTGFRPQPHIYPTRGAQIPEGRVSIPGNRAWVTAGVALSGQRHLEVLRDRVFHTYADLKRNPATAFGTRLYWHNLRDNEHWRVIPKRFSISRAIPKRTVSSYRIEMLAVAPALAADIIPLTTKSLLEGIRDFARGIRSIIQTARSFINDITSFIGEVQRTISDIGSVFTTALGIIDDASRFIGGATDLILSPFTALTGVVTRLDTVARSFYGTIARTVPEKFISAWRGFTIACESLALFPSQFSSGSPTGRVTRPRGAVVSGVAALSTQPTTDDVQATLQAVQNDGRRLGQPVNASIDYAGLRLVTVTDADTIQTIAQNHDVAWQDVAALNQLTPPYISRHAEPGTLGPGSTIVVPTLDPPPADVTIPSVAGARPEYPEEVRLFGEDFLMELNDDGTYGFPLNADGTDSLTVSGVDNLVQAMHTRMRTGQGEDVLFPELGILPVVGSGNQGLDREMAALRVTQAVAADPRIASAASVAATVLPGSEVTDTIDVEVIAVVRGLREPVIARAAFPR